MNYEAGFRAERGEPLTIAVNETEVGRDAPSKRRRLRLILIAVAILGVLAAAYFLLGGGEAPVAEEGESEAFTVSVTAPGRTTVAGEISTTGTLAARREIPVGVVGEGGRVVSVPVDQGDWVRQGQVLAVIDRSVQSQQAQSAAAQIQVAQADAELAQANLDRALQLVERGFISKAEVDRLTATRDAARARVRVAQAQYRELLARNARLNIVAPASGLVLERNVQPGQTVSGGATPLFLIAKDGEMELLAQLGEADLARISAGASAVVTPVGTEQKFTGQIWQIEPTIDPEDRQGTARIALSYALGLRPGGFATAVIKSGTVVAPVLPESAIMSDDAGSYVYIVGAGNKVVRRPIVPGDVTAEGIVVAQGLSGRERVILRAGGFLNAGEVVDPVAAEAAQK